MNKGLLLDHQLFRANKVYEWNPSDDEKNYKPVNKFGKNLYQPGDFHYSFNEYGFRCDSFALPTDISIVFIGDSNTEGIGLPVECTWAYKLLSKIKEATNKNIAYWNLGIGGTGIDTQARYLYDFSNSHKIDFIFAYLPTFHRREYSFSSNKVSCWQPFAPSKDINIDAFFTDDSFAKHQSLRSLMIIDSVRKANNSTMYTTSWGIGISDMVTILEDFPNLNLFSTRHEYTDLARDSVHRGPQYHSYLCDSFWRKTKHHFVSGAG